jgi:HEPN domain-containing protein
MSFRPPLWGNFVGHADQDFLAFGLLNAGGMFVLAAYHGTQAIEKYLKALALSIVDLPGTTATPVTEPWIKTHNLEKLARRCGTKYPFYVQQNTLDLLKRFAEFDQLARYPWVEQNHGNGFTTADIPIFGDLILQLRKDIPISKDNYSLGIEVRGHYHNAEKSPVPTWDVYPHHAVEALRSLFPNINDFVRW